MQNHPHAGVFHQFTLGIIQLKVFSNSKPFSFT
ncbi:MAG: hypothetical protein ACJAVI_003360 [Candidatus Azotimanducaceae bacterium]|jgi:hypothetical protein